MGGGAGSSGPKVLKKIYFIKKARKGEELTTLLKNKFKSIDAIRDLLRWFEEGRDFVASVRRSDEPELAESSSDLGAAALDPKTLFGDDEPTAIAPSAPSGKKKKGGGASRDPGAKSVVISPWMPTAQNYRNMIDIVGTIIAWMDKGRDFDITLTPQRSFDASASMN